MFFVLNQIRIMRKLFIAAFLSIALISCDGGTSSNTESRRVENNSQSVEPGDDGSTVTQVNGATIRLDAQGNPTVVDDPTGEIEATRNSDGTISVTDGTGSTVIFNPEDE